MGMGMHRDPHTAASPAHPNRPTTTTSRWLVVAVALCGALAGGSIVEAIASLASRSSMPLSPDHLIAEPLALVGALCGGLLAALLASKDQRHDIPRDQTAADLLASAEVTPVEPMMWQPAPHMLPVSQPVVSATEASIPLERRTPRTHRAVRARHSVRSRSIRAPLSRPPVLD
jgi:hypothetical protein